MPPRIAAIRIQIKPRIPRHPCGNPLVYPRRKPSQSRQSDPSVQGHMRQFMGHNFRFLPGWAEVKKMRPIGHGAGLIPAHHLIAGLRIAHQNARPLNWPQLRMHARLSQIQTSQEFSGGSHRFRFGVDARINLVKPETARTDRRQNRREAQRQETDPEAHQKSHQGEDKTRTPSPGHTVAAPELSSCPKLPCTYREWLLLRRSRRTIFYAEL